MIQISRHYSHQPHEYLRETLDLRYRECSACNTRSQFTCIRCGFCYSCHWKKEELERIPPYFMLGDR